MKAALLVFTLVFLFFFNCRLPQLDAWRPNIFNRQMSQNSVFYHEKSLNNENLPRVCTFGQLYALLIIMFIVLSAVSRHNSTQCRFKKVVSFLLLLGICASLVLNWNAAVYFFIVFALLSLFT